MGWLFEGTRRSKSEYITALLNEHYPETGADQLMARATSGNHLWVVLKPDGQRPIIGLYLLSKHQGCWGYKSMDESMGLYAFDCPLRFLELAPEPDGYNKDLWGLGRNWREEVVAFHALQKLRRSQRPKVGDRLALCAERFPGYGGTYTVTKDLGRKGLLLDDFLRMNMQQIKYAKVIPGWGPSA